jgi:hypothetical protein
VATAAENRLNIPAQRSHVVAALSGWNCGCCEHKKGASLYAPGSSRTRGNSSAVNGSRPEDLRLLQDPKWVSFSIAASIAIAATRFRLRC